MLCAKIDGTKEPIMKILNKNISSPFIDGVLISFNTDLQMLKILKYQKSNFKRINYNDSKEYITKYEHFINQKEIFVEKIKNYSKIYKDELQCLVQGSKYNVQKSLKWWKQPDKSLYVQYKPKHHSFTVFFKGSFFLSTNNYIDDFKNLYKHVNIIINDLNKYLLMYFNQKEIPYINVTVAQIDLAQNHYDAKILDPKKQIIARSNIPINIWEAYGTPLSQDKDKKRLYCPTSIYTGRKDTKRIYFRAYDKNYDNPKPKENARIRFGTDNFCRNEWSLRTKELQRKGLKSWVDWVFLCDKNYKSRIEFNNFFIHLRKQRDCTYYKSRKHKYNLIHLDKGFQTWKKPRNYTDIKIKEWLPHPTVIGLIKNHKDKYNMSDKISIMCHLHVIDKEFLPKNILEKLFKHWQKSGIDNISLDWRSYIKS